MAQLKELFLSHIGQTSAMPLMLEVKRAKGVFVYDTKNKKYFDMNSGIAVSSLGHGHPEIVNAICKQAGDYMHTMVYGEHIQTPQILFSKKLTDLIDPVLESVYFLMSGTEATELGMKLAKKHTGRYEIIACNKAYHGSTQGAESLRSDEDYKAPFRPLLPGIKHIEFNNIEALEKISNKTACVICEVIQGEAGVVSATEAFLQGLSKKCETTGTLLILDEIQSGFGRTGTLFAYQQYNVVPDILLIGKAMGGGMPLAGVVSSKKILNTLLNNPALGHITTFGGHPVSCAAALAALNVLLDERLIDSISEKEAYIKATLEGHPIINEVRSAGLMMAVEPIKKKYLKHIVSKAFELGVLVDWFLFNNRSFRLAPPLIITLEELKETCTLLLSAMDYAEAVYI